MLLIRYHTKGSDQWESKLDVGDDGIEGIRVSIVDAWSLDHPSIDEVVYRVGVRLERDPIPWIEPRSNKWWILHLDRLREELLPEHRMDWLSGPILRSPRPTIAMEGRFDVTTSVSMVQFFLYPDVRSSATRVFVVHGRDQAAREKTARLLERIGLEPIILSERLNDGAWALIDKLEKHADVSYAIALLTGDDRGGPKDQHPEDQNLRARQNVVFELGYFLSKLGRERVCVLYEPHVEIPSDFQGIAYHELDAGDAWRHTVARELRSAGFRVDLNAL